MFSVTITHSCYPLVGPTFGSDLGIKYGLKMSSASLITAITQQSSVEHFFSWSFNLIAFDPKVSVSLDLIFNGHQVKKKLRPHIYNFISIHHRCGYSVVKNMGGQQRLRTHTTWWNTSWSLVTISYLWKVDSSYQRWLFFRQLFIDFQTKSSEIKQSIKNLKGPVLSKLSKSCNSGKLIPWKSVASEWWACELLYKKIKGKMTNRRKRENNRKERNSISVSYSCLLGNKETPPTPSKLFFIPENPQVPLVPQKNNDIIIYGTKKKGIWNVISTHTLQCITMNMDRAQDRHKIDILPIEKPIPFSLSADLHLLFQLLIFLWMF